MTESRAMATANRLKNESSLYLRQHSRNPVDWYPWGDEAITHAKHLDRPIFLSIGYSACHWCHVMEHESFEDAATTEVMNANFICVKVDREERPDLDQIYMTSLQLLTRDGGGWPLSVFLTPELTPFYAGTYFPPKDMYGRPSFRRVLLAVAESWKTKREQLVNVGAQVAEALKDSHRLASQEGELNETTLKIALAGLKNNYDPKNGGFGHAPKFPHSVDLRLLLRLGHRFNDADAMTMVAHTLEMMARGGIYDQIGGGFARYSVDEKWLVPHFEKMLYDNALLAHCLLEAFQISGDSFFSTIARETLDFVVKELTSPFGGFYSTLDADSEGEEGKFYVWSEAELDSILGSDAAFAKEVWGVTSRGNFESHNILFRNDRIGHGEKLAAIRKKLYDVRSQRIGPGRDEKMLTAWNGLMITAFAHASWILDEPKYLQKAKAAMTFVLSKLYRDGQLLRTCGDAHAAKLAAYLEDYAYLIDALLALYDADFDAKWITIACGLADVMLNDYRDKESGGFFYSVSNQKDVIARTKDWHDGSTPSGNAVAATVLLKLAILCDRPDYREAARGTLNAFRGLVNDNPAAASQMLIALDFDLGPVREVTVIGDAGDPDFPAVRAALKKFHPRQVLAVHASSEALPAAIALFRHKPLSKRVTTYICRNYECEAPIVGPLS